MEDLQVKIVTPLHVSQACNVEIFCFSPANIASGEKFTQITIDPEDPYLLRRDLLEPGNHEVKPLIRLPNDIFLKLCKAALEYAAENKLPVQPEKSFSEGKLEATEKNLNHLMANFDKLVDKIVSQ